MKTWWEGFPWQAIERQAVSLGLDPLLVGAIVQTESAGKSFSTRFEPAFRYTTCVAYYAALLGQSLDTEETGQKTSWGLLHVMGATARTLGFTGYFPELCLPETGLQFGCRYLHQQMERYKNSAQHAVAAYNAGSSRLTVGAGGIATFVNQVYVDRVMKNLEELRTAKI